MHVLADYWWQWQLAYKCLGTRMTERKFGPERRAAVEVCWYVGEMQTGVQKYDAFLCARLTHTQKCACERAFRLCMAIEVMLPKERPNFWKKWLA